MRNEICMLTGIKSEGSRIERVTEEIFCRKKSSTRSEFYGAYAVGLKPKFVLEIDLWDWENLSGKLPDDIEPTRVGYRGIEYHILRRYQTNENTMELTVG